MTAICGILPLRSAVKLGYPFELAVRSLQRFCNHVVVSVDPTTDDAEETIRRLFALNGDVVSGSGLVPIEIIRSTWNMANHDGMRNNEISVQTDILLEFATYVCPHRADWVYSLQADEIIHEKDAQLLRELVPRLDADGRFTGIEQTRTYFYGNLKTIREDWTIPMVRLFKRGMWEPDRDGAMRFWPKGCPGDGEIATDCSSPCDVPIYHYSRIGDPRLIAERIRGLDRLFHTPEKVADGELPPYDFSPRQLDTYVIGAEAQAAEGVLVPYTGGHPAGIVDFYCNIPGALGPQPGGQGVP